MNGKNSMSITILEFENNGEVAFSVKGGKYYDAFSEVKIIFRQKGKEYIVFKDFIIEGIRSLKSSLIMAIESKLNANLENKKSMGLIWNEYVKNLNMDVITDDPIEKYHVWSTTSDNGIETWIYNLGDEIFIEISSIYEWNFGQADSINLKKYEHYMKNYEPIAVLEITKQTASCWLKKCEVILDKF
jgi:hypothetical protein